jgi:hypothetical protein
MVEKLSFGTIVWNRLRPQALAAAVETGEHALLWARILIIHFIKLTVALARVDPDIIRVASFMEKWVWIATFAMFFCRIVIRLWRIPRA